MQQSDAKHYFERRAAEERAAAEHASDERAAEPHRELARRYEGMASGTIQPARDESMPKTPGLPAEFTILP